MNPSAHRILLLCQDAATLEQMRQHLERQGFPVRGQAAAHGVLAVDREWQPDLLISDYEISEAATHDVIQALHRQNPALRFIIIIPQGRTLEVMRSMRNRVAAFLSTPFTMDDLSYYVNNVLSAKDEGPNRREHKRYMFTVETHLNVVNPFSGDEGRPVPALMRDVSRAGASMIVRQLLPVPAILKIIVSMNDQTRPMTLLAKSISCIMTQIPGVYRVGAKFLGLLPREMAEAMLPVGQGTLGQKPDEDIYMGKSFRDAVREWLGEHRHEEMVRRPGKQLNELAIEMARAESEHESSTQPAPGEPTGPIVPRLDLLPLDLYLKNFSLDETLPAVGQRARRTANGNGGIRGHAPVNGVDSGAPGMPTPNPNLDDTNE